MTEILRSAGVSLSLPGEGPHQLSRKRSLALVPILQSLPASEIANALHLRDFRRSAILEFFNTIESEVDIAFHNIRLAYAMCSSKAKMSALSKVEMSVSAPVWDFGGCHFDGHGGDEQARAEPS